MLVVVVVICGHAIISYAHLDEVDYQVHDSCGGSMLVWFSLEQKTPQGWRVVPGSTGYWGGLAENQIIDAGWFVQYPEPGVYRATGRLVENYGSSYYVAPSVPVTIRLAHGGKDAAGTR